MPEIFRLWGTVGVEKKSAINSLRDVRAAAALTRKELEKLEKVVRVGGVRGGGSFGTGSGGYSTPRGGRGRGSSPILLPADNQLFAAAQDIQRMQQQRMNWQRSLAPQLAANQRAQERVLKRRNDDEIKRLKKTPKPFAHLGEGLSLAGSVAGGAAGVGLIAGGAAIAGLSIAIQKTIEADRANRLLASSALEAGKSYGFLVDKNAEYAKMTGQSNVAAARQSAMITRLAAQSGQSENIGGLMKSFANLGAAYGIDPNQMEDLIGTILSGQDEGLNRLGISDPGRLYAEFAKRNKLGNPDNLSQQQKTQAIAEAVQKKAGIFDGAAENRMKSLEGNVASTTAAWDNFTTAMSASIAKSYEMQTALKTVGTLMKWVAGDQENFQKKVLAGTLTTADFKNQSEMGWGSRLMSGGAGLAGLSLLPLAGIAGITDMLGLTQGAARSMGNTATTSVDMVSGLFGSGQGAIDREKAVFEEINAQARIEADNKKIRATMAADQQDLYVKEATERSAKLAKRDAEFRHKIQSTGGAAAFSIGSALINARPDFNKQQELASTRDMAALRSQDLRRQLDETAKNAAELLKVSNLSADDRAEIEAKTTAEMIRLGGELATHQINAQKDILLAERAAAEERKKMAQEFSAIQASAFEAQTGRNSMTLATQASKNIADAFDTFKDFDIKMARAAESAARIAEAMKLGSAAFESGMSALGFRSQAAREAMRDPDDLSGRSRRRDALSEALGFAGGSQGYKTQAALASALGRNPGMNMSDWENFAQLNDYAQNASEFDAVARRVGDTGAGGAAILAQAKLAALPDIATLARLAQPEYDENGNLIRAGSRSARNALFTVADLNKTLAQDQERQLEKTLAKNAALDKVILPDAQAQMDFIARERAAGRITDKAALDAFLATTEELGDEITPEMLKMRVSALKERAQIEEKNRQELIDAVKNIKQEVLVNVYGDGANGTMNGRPLQSRTRSTR
jgi:hypothetical protein